MIELLKEASTVLVIPILGVLLYLAFSDVELLSFLDMPPESFVMLIFLLFLMLISSGRNT